MWASRSIVNDSSFACALSTFYAGRPASGEDFFPPLSIDMDGFAQPALLSPGQLLLL
jgi:hypothetical protein